jgi:hypothetical protein
MFEVEKRETLRFQLFVALDLLFDLALRQLDHDDASVSMSLTDTISEH